MDKKSKTNIGPEPMSRSCSGSAPPRSTRSSGAPSCHLSACSLAPEHSSPRATSTSRSSNRIKVARSAGLILSNYGRSARSTRPCCGAWTNAPQHAATCSPGPAAKTCLGTSLGPTTKIGMAEHHPSFDGPRRVPGQGRALGPTGSGGRVRLCRRAHSERGDRAMSWGHVAARMMRAGCSRSKEPAGRGPMHSPPDAHRASSPCR